MSGEARYHKTTIRDLEKYAIELEETGYTFLPDAALERASRHSVWMLALYVGGCDAAEVTEDFERNGRHIRVQNESAS